MTMEPAAGVANKASQRPDFLSPPVAPQDEVEVALVGIWERILDLTPIGIDDDFFQLDGDSFMAVNLFAEIEDRWACKFSPSSVAKSSTIRALATLIRGFETNASHPAVVVFNDSGSRPPLYLIHGRGGDVDFAHPIGEALDPDQPMFGLRYAPGHGTWPRPATVEGIAAAYASLLRARHGDGPFRLGGYSVGAELALETARHVTSQGGVVEFVIMIAPPIAPGIRRRKSAHGARDVFSPSFGKAIAALAGRLWADLKRFVRNLFVWSPHDGQIEVTGSAGRAVRQQMSELTLVHRAYRPKPYDGPVTIISCADSRRVHRDSTIGWSELIRGPIRTIEMPGTQDSIVKEPLVRELAVRLAECLRDNPGS